MGSFLPQCEQLRAAEGDPPNHKPRPLVILIVGAGIGGLTAAVSLRHNGHHVTLLEQSRLASEAGAAVHLTPNANGLLRRCGIFAETFGSVPNDRVLEYVYDGRLLTDINLVQANKRWAHPWLIAQRTALHTKLKEAATATHGTGTPAVLQTSSKVVRVDAELGRVWLDNGTSLMGDVILGADGIHSSVRSVLSNASPYPTGKAAFRFQVTYQLAADDALTRRLSEQKNSLCTWLAKDRRVVMYSCDDNRLLNFVCIHPDDESHREQTTTWSKQGDLSQMLRVFENFDPTLTGLMRKANPAQIKVWQLMDMEEIPWTRDRVALLGDAAHPFTPHQGQGAAMAIEDAASLSVVLPQGTKPEEVVERLQLYEQIRRERAHKIQELSRQAGRDWVEGKLNVDNTDFTHAFDEFDNSIKHFRRWLWAQKPAISSQMPIGFGPSPSPLQDYYGRQYQSKEGGGYREFTTLNVRFKTSRTVLQNMFPTDQFQFRRVDTVCTASWSITKFGRVPWLGGEGYCTMALFFHGVRYVRKKDGSMVNGAFIPVLFESLSDAVVAGRELFGLPKFGCDVQLNHSGSTCRATATWKGSKLVEITLPKLEEIGKDSVEGGAYWGETNVLAYRYIPSVDEPDKPDAAYACVVTHADEGRVKNGGTITFAAQSAEANIDCQAHDWDALPTLHHIASILAEIPVYEILHAKLVKGIVNGTAPRARRIE